MVLRSEAQPAVVTLDACGGRNGSGYDEALIEVLRRLAVPATLFLNLRWIDANPGIARELADDPLFELANHGTAHKPLSVSGAEAYGIPGTASVGDVFDEVMGGHARLAELTARDSGSSARARITALTRGEWASVLRPLRLPLGAPAPGRQPPRRLGAGVGMGATSPPAFGHLLSTEWRGGSERGIASSFGARVGDVGAEIRAGVSPG